MKNKYVALYIVSVFLFWSFIFYSVVKASNAEIKWRLEHGQFVRR